MKNFKNGSKILGLFLACAAFPVLSAVSAQEADALGKSLTPMGAERAGNADGSIPEWTGGYSESTEAYEKGDRRVDPFADDKPLYTITADNMAEYEDKLSEGVKALLNKYNTFRIDVYPTRRTALAPEWYYEATRNNATSVKLSEDGLALDAPNVSGGVPFPIPQNGDEVRWNAELAWRGESMTAEQKIWTVTPGGQQVLASHIEAHQQYAWNYAPDSDIEFIPGETPTLYYMQFVKGPAFRAGEGLVGHYPMNYEEESTRYWSYLAGQRRVRRAPTVGFDTPDFVASGANFFDEVSAPTGDPVRFDWKLIGKKEMIVPYNNNKLFSVADAEAMGKNHLKPEYMRWELHRVWVIEAIRADDQRHAVSKRRFYVDEDSWANLLTDGWDDKGSLWRTTFLLGFTAPDIPAYVGGTCYDTFFNLQTGQYVFRCSMGDGMPQHANVAPRSANFFAPDALAGRGMR